MIGVFFVVKFKELVKFLLSKKLSIVVVILIFNILGAVVIMSGVKLGSMLVMCKLKFGWYMVKVVKVGFIELVQKVVIEIGEK